MANVHVILDEAASLGPNMGCIEDAIDKYRGYGIRLQLYYQSPAQLKKCFPNEQDQTVLANVTQVYFAVNDASAETISNRLGEETIVVESGSRSSGYSHQSGWAVQGQSTSSDNTTWNWSQMGRKLLKPDEILSLNERMAITFVAGMRPILTRLERYYERRSGKRPLSVFTTFVLSVLIFVAATYCFILTVDYLKKAQDGRIIQRAENIPPGNGRGTQTPGHSRVNGTGKRTLQRPRLRPVRPRPIHSKSRERIRGPGANSR